MAAKKAVQIDLAAGDYYSKRDISRLRHYFGREVVVTEYSGRETRGVLTDAHTGSIIVDDLNYIHQGESVKVLATV